ncbi:hypothetical protein F4825DRAFT_412573 [Nemania diffusa]|nr:hypothetical protein F4825DRAFT_412573 [Nemania diffusa]
MGMFRLCSSGPKFLVGHVIGETHCFFSFFFFCEPDTTASRLEVLVSMITYPLSDLILFISILWRS